MSVVETRTPKCRWDADKGWLTPEHVRDCDEHGCSGCKPCPKTHCAMRGTCPSHVQPDRGIITCPGCVGRTRTDLLAIAARYDELDDEAETAGVNSEAANLRGPAAFRVPMAKDDPHHPLLVLGRWDMMLREDYGHDTALTLTVARAVEYLTKNLTHIANDDGQDFELMSREVAACRSHLETVLHDSREPEKGAPCPSCRGDDEAAPRLHKVWADRVADDRWQCPRVPEHRWTEDEYRLRVDGDYLEHADALTADQMHQQWEVKPGTLRRWANDEPPSVRKRGRDQYGRQLYDVGDVQVRLAARPDTRAS